MTGRWLDAVARWAARQLPVAGRSSGLHHRLGLQVVATLSALIFAFNFCFEIFVLFSLGKERQLLILVLELCLASWALAEAVWLRWRWPDAALPMRSLLFWLLAQCVLELARMLPVLHGLPGGVDRIYGIQALDLGLLVFFIPLYALLFFGTSRALLRIHDHELHVAHAQVTALAVIESRQQERDALLHDVHDGFGTQLASLRIMVQRGHLAPEQLPQYLQELSADLHLVVSTLGQQDVSLADALHDMRYRIDGHLGGQGVQFHWLLDLEDAPSLTTRTILQILRIVQEALNNAWRHAQAKNITVQARFDAASGELSVSVQDDGVGMPEQPAAGRGLASMRHRAREIGAQLALGAAYPGSEVSMRLEVSGINPARRA